MRSKIPFLGKKTKVVIRLNWKLMVRLIWIWKIQWWCSFLLFRPEVSVFGKFFPKNQNCWIWNLELRLIWMWIWRIALVILFFLFVFVVVVVVVVFHFLDWKHLFWVNLVQKLKTVSWSWNLVPNLYWIRKIWWWCSFSLF